ncbi:hypothetical protein [Burkholderia gladioli]|uniref:hypothetical protein n=1 Tax=Burkholderia gladioli TaxID=28095 RepID=UPI001641ECDA|nr:hypothetical protein [Burkholderia gladioli]
MDPKQENGDAADNAVQQPENQDGPQGTDGSRRGEPPPKWAMTRIGELTRQRKEAEQNAERLAAENARLLQQLGGSGAGGGGGDGGSGGSGEGNGGGRAGTGAPSQQAVEEMAERIAAQRLAQREYLDSIQKTEQAGRKEFQDFDQVVQQFGAIGGIPAPMFQAINRLENPHRVLYRLGNDLELASRLTSMDPISLGIELARMAGVPRPMSADEAGGRLPAPIEPPAGRSSGGGGGGGDVDLDDKLSDEEWHAARDRQRRAAR